jgi:hypothetical protein
MASIFVKATSGVPLVALFAPPATQHALSSSSFYLVTGDT